MVDCCLLLVICPSCYHCCHRDSEHATKFLKLISPVTINRRRRQQHQQAEVEAAAGSSNSAVYTTATVPPNYLKYQVTINRRRRQQHQQQRSVRNSDHTTKQKIFHK